MFILLLILGSLATVSIVALGLCLLTIKALMPLLVTTSMAAGPTASTARVARSPIISVKGIPLISSCSFLCICSWTTAPMLFIVMTVSTGYLPTAVSPLSITASAPSRRAFATSLASARVGLGFSVMDSSIWVATMTGLPLWLQASMIFFWSSGTSHGGISMPRSPLATMMPSLASIISLILCTASPCSTLLISGWVPPSLIMAAPTASTSFFDLTKLAANQSHSISTPNLMPSMSFLVGGLSDSFAPGAFTPFLLDATPPDTTLTVKPFLSASIFMTSKSMMPSLMKR